MDRSRRFFRQVTNEEQLPLNNNRNNNNRRRGRGNRPQGSGGGGNQMNRIDSRARGNAPQLLDKYKKLAQDAQHNGDRVQAEYYLQFADHYFRVIADNKARQDEARGKRNEDRDDQRGSNDDGDDDRGDRRNQRGPRGRSDERDNRDAGDDTDEREDSDERDEGEEAARRQERRNERRSRNRNEKSSREGEQAQERGSDDNGNPFLRDEKPARKPRKSPTRKPADDKIADDRGGIDASALPPAIGGSEGEDAPAKKLGIRRRKKADEDDGPLKAVG